MRRVVFNQKGGVGKSSIVSNLAAISASRGVRTLVVDLDPHDTPVVGVGPPGVAVRGRLPVQHHTLKDRSRPNLDVHRFARLYRFKFLLLLWCHRSSPHLYQGPRAT